MGRAGRRTVLGVVALVAAVVVGVLAVVLALSSGDEDAVSGGAAAGLDRWDLVQAGGEAPYLPTLANADLSVGMNRLSFTVQDARGLTVSDVDVVARIYDLERDRERPVDSVAAFFISYGAESPLPQAHRHVGGSGVSDAGRYVGAGVYVAPVRFGRAGIWGIEFAIKPPEGEETLVHFRLSVREESQAPGLGEMAPASRTRSLGDEPDIRRLTSDPAPEPGLYQLRLDEALRGGQPLIVAFSTPAFCHSRTCGPTLEIVKQVWRAWAPRVQAIHVEIFENPHEPQALREAAAFLEWDLPSEPWVFVIDAGGTIRARFEGTVTVQELTEAVKAVLGE